MKLPTRKSRMRFARRKAVAKIEILALLLCLFVLSSSDYVFLVRHHYSTSAPASGPLFLLSNMAAFTIIIVIGARRLAIARTAGENGKRASPLHMRLVTIFAATAILPIASIALFSSFLIESGMSFWFSDSARTLLTTTNHVADAYIKQNELSVLAEMPPMISDFRNALSQVDSMQDPRVSPFMLEQFRNRHLAELALVAASPGQSPSILAFVNISKDQDGDKLLPTHIIERLKRGIVSSDIKPDRIEVRGMLDSKSGLYLYASRRIDPLVYDQTIRAKSALGNYANLLIQSKRLQVRLDTGLLVFSIIMIMLFMWLAVAVADRLIKPISLLVKATRQLSSGDLTVRVSPPESKDELWSLAAAFNRMARRMEGQTDALVAANQQLDQRREFIETIFSAISTGIISTDQNHQIQLVNQQAKNILKLSSDELAEQPLSTISREIDTFLTSGRAKATLHLPTTSGPVMLAIKSFDIDHGAVITFDDITQQQIDQKRAAWSDVARRIAHEIKNPLTPIQLAAERLERRFTPAISVDVELFRKLTSTIMRQVSDLRLMVDEFSSFARLADPVFRQESINEIAQEALILFEVAHPDVNFLLRPAPSSPYILSDRSMINRALSNIIKNAVESVQEKEPLDAFVATVEIDIHCEGSLVSIHVVDNGPGFPKDIDNLTEPYVTNRSKGTGLGLAIVKKIIEEHFGTLTLVRRKSGGAEVVITLDQAKPPLTMQNDEQRI